MPQALVVREFGGPEAPALEERPELVPGPGEVVIDLRAAALNRRDLRVIAGGWPGVSAPLVPGSDGAGVVRSLGAGVSGLAEGDEVIILPAIDWGDDPRVLGPGFQHPRRARATARSPSRCACPPPTSSPSPRGSRFEYAAALPLAGLTAWRALFARGGPAPPGRPCSCSAPARAPRRSPCSSRARPARACSSPRARPASSPARSSSAPRPASTTARAAGSRRSSSAAAAASTSCIDSAGTWRSSAACVRAGGRVVVFGAHRRPDRRARRARVLLQADRPARAR